MTRYEQLRWILYGDVFNLLEFTCEHYVHKEEWMGSAWGLLRERMVNSWGNQAKQKMCDKGSFFMWQNTMGTVYHKHSGWISSLEQLHIMGKWCVSKQL